MGREDGSSKCLAYLGSQSRPRAGSVRVERKPHLAIALSRQAGSGAEVIAERLAAYLQAYGPADDRPWTVFDKNLISAVLEDHHLPTRLARFLPEDKVDAISDMVDEILGMHPPSWVIVHQSVETILKLAELGNVILVGRGAAVITRRLAGVLCVRLVGSQERRLARVQETEHLSRAEALRRIRRSDRGRARYVKRYFRRDVADELLYDLTINTDRISEDEVARLVGDVVLRRLQSGHVEVKRTA
jgi:hypothetical protein